MRVLVFGDSITQGFHDTEGGWVERVRKHYAQRQNTDLANRDEPVVFNLGISADNSQNVLSRIENETKVRTRHGNLPVVVIQIGVNDSSQDEFPPEKSVKVPLDQYKENIKAIITKVAPISSKIVFVGLSACDETRTTPVSWGEYFYTNSAIKAYEDAIQDITEEHGVAFIPVFDRFKEVLDSGKDFLPDGLHPNNEGHEFLSKIILQELDFLLQS